MISNGRSTAAQSASLLLSAYTLTRQGHKSDCTLLIVVPKQVEDIAQ